MLLLELAIPIEHMPSAAEELLAEAKKAIEWLRKIASNSNTAQHIWTTMCRLLRLAARRVGFDTGESGVVDTDLEPSVGLRYPAASTTVRRQPCVSTTSSQFELSNSMSYTPAFDPTAFGNFVPYIKDPVQAREQSYRNLLDPSEFSFDLKSTAKTTPPPYDGATAIGQMSPVPSAIPQQLHGGGLQDDGYLTDDFFGLNCSGD